MDSSIKEKHDSSDEINLPEFCDVLKAESRLLKIEKNEYDIVSSSTVSTPVSTPLKGITWPSPSWADGTHRSAFQPYRPIVCNTVLTNLQRGNTETETPKEDFSEFTWHQKAGRGDITARDVPSDSNIDRVDSQGLTALMWASSYGQYSSVKLLLRSGALINKQGLKGETSLLLSASEGHLDVLRILIASGAKVNHTDKSGNTSLIYASYNNHHHCVNELLLNGADLTMKNHAGVSAYSAAVKRNSQLVLAVIENYLVSLLEEGEHIPKNS